MKRDRKEEIVQQVAEKINRSQGIYLTEFQGLSVAKMSELRREFRKVGVEYRVVKNTLIKQALKDLACADKLAPGLKSTTAVAFGFDDPVAPAKVIRKFSKTNDALKFKMAAIDGVVFGSDGCQCGYEKPGMRSRSDCQTEAINYTKLLRTHRIIIHCKLNKRGE